MGTDRTMRASINSSIKNLAIESGADLYGVADLSQVKDEVMRQGGPMAADYPYAISIGIALMKDIVDQLPHREERAVAVNYKHHCYDVINSRLDLIASKISSALQNHGYRALPIPSSQRIDDERICALFSHKLAAHAAGLGWIGRSCLLITPEHGPRVRWVTILTDAPLTPTGTLRESKCGECRNCVDICPVHAFTGRAFIEGEPREARYDARRCEEYLKSIEKPGMPGVCGLCIYSCPHGKKRRA